MAAQLGVNVEQLIFHHANAGIEFGKTMLDGFAEAVDLVEQRLLLG